MKKLMCFTHWDLDGVVSYLVLRWAYPKATVEYLPTTVANFRNNYTKWLSNNNLEDYDMVFIMDLGIFEDKDLIDHKNVFVIDHHPGHDNKTYKNAKSVIRSDYPSACKLAYKVFKGICNIKITDAQKHLLVLANDFDSYKLDIPDSVKLNTLFWDTNDKFKEFTKSFLGGFNGFNLKQENIIKLHDIKLEKIKNELVVYTGKDNIQDKERYICATFTNSCINEVADILLGEYNADIAIIINTNTNHVSYRRQNDSDIDLAKLANDLADGYGHEFSSGSEITDNFMEFTKKLNKI